MEFKVRDRVKIKRDAPRKWGGWSYDQLNNAEGGIITKIDSAGRYYIEKGNGTFFNAEEDLELIESKGTIMEKIRDFYKSIMKSEPEKSLNKAGLTDSNDVLTDEGKEVFIAYLLEQNKAAFKTAVADPIIAAQAEEK